MGSFGEVLFADGVDRTMVANLRSLMANTGWTLDRAMDALSVPAEDRERYAEKIAPAGEPEGAVTSEA